MSAATTWHNEIISAQLSHLAIYSPSLGPTDETFDQQLVFYYSRDDTQNKTQRKEAGTKTSTSDNDTALRQIGLAQGLVNFASTFSNGAPVNSVETETSRVILQELEDGWWLYASIDLTKIPQSEPNQAKTTTTKSSTTKDVKPTTKYEYSSREVSPAPLLIKQVLQAHSIFCLHHGPYIASLYSRLPRDRFCGILDRFWSRFAKTWDVLLHGNPASDILAGIKLASGGELGFGVGEEEWGSGEREVLEDMTRQTEGLVDTVVARFGDPAKKQLTSFNEDSLPWAGAGSEPAVSDGIIFGGVGALSRPSLQNVSLWMRQIYANGEHAYGVRDPPGRERRRKKRRQAEPITPANGHAELPAVRAGPKDRLAILRKPSSAASITDQRPSMYDRVASQDHAMSTTSIQSAKRPGIPPPIVSAAEVALLEATRKAEKQATSSRGSQSGESGDSGTTLGIPDQYMKYLTFGLSTLAKPSKSSTPSPRRSAAASRTVSKASIRDTSSTADPSDAEDQASRKMSLLEPMPDGEVLNHRIARQKRQEDQGHFIIGLKGDLDAIRDDDDAELTESSLHDGTDGHRTVLRTVHVELITPSKQSTDDNSETTVGDDAQPQSTRLRVLIYAHRPFLFCFLFEQRTTSLSYTGFYRNLHRNLQPVHKSLLSSTDTRKVAERLAAAMNPLSQNTGQSEGSEQPIYDLLYDPIRMTVHASIPNIPDPGTLAAEALSGRNGSATWSRLEALNVHSAILSTLDDTASRTGEIERISKTNRGWWIVWMRVPSSQIDDHDLSDKKRIAFIVRKASDAMASNKPSASSRAVSGMWNTLTFQATSDDNTPAERIAGLGTSGVGFDARKYVESLLSLNR